MISDRNSSSIARTRRNLIAWATLMLATISGCSSSNDTPEAAQRVAEQWVSANIERIAEVVASVVSKEYSALTKPLIAMAVKNGMSFRYVPERMSAESWRVAVKASNTIDLSRFGVKKAVSARGEIILFIDTDRRLVKKYSLRPSSVEAKLVEN